MGGGNPVKKLTSVVSDVFDNRIVKGVLTGGGSEVVSKFETSDTLKALTGRETSAEKAAKGEQQASLLAAKQEADTALEARKKRMLRKDKGRASLLSGSELGVQATDLKSTLG